MERKCADLKVSRRVTVCDDIYYYFWIMYHKNEAPVSVSLNYYVKGDSCFDYYKRVG